MPADRGGVHLIRGAAAGDRAGSGRRSDAGLGWGVFTRLILQTLQDRLGANALNHRVAHTASAGNLAIVPPHPLSIAQQPQHRPALVLVGPALAVAGIGVVVWVRYEHWRNKYKTGA